MMIGKFAEKKDGSYTGQVSSFALKVAGMTFRPMPVKQGSGPDFVVLGSDAGHEYEIGAA